MKILHVITSLRMGGAERLMLDLLPRIKSAGHEVDLLVFDATPTPLRRQLEDAGIRIIDSATGKSVYHPKHLASLYRIYRNYDIIHTHNTACQFFAALVCRDRNRILITTEHNTSNRRRKWKFFRFIDRMMYRRYDHIICISAKAESNLRNHLGDSRYEISTVNNGIDVRRYKEAAASSSLEMMAPMSRKIIMVAAFRWEKDQDTLIKALEFLPDRFHLFLVGNGVRESRLIDLAKDTGVESRVHFMGLRRDVPSLLHEADYIVMSSHFEGLSLSSIEGMCAGHPFIASDVDGLHDVVDGFGLLFEHQNERQLADIILELEASPERAGIISSQCLRRAEDFDISGMVGGYLDIYREKGLRSKWISGPSSKK